jgi:hypothetical protein
MNDDMDLLLEFECESDLVSASFKVLGVNVR